LTDPPTASPSTISSIAAILQAIAWPLVAALLLVIYKSKTGKLFDVLTRKLETATKVKAWQVEIETAVQDVQDVVQRTGEGAKGQTLDANIPEAQVRAAHEVNKRLQESPLSEQRAAGVAQRQMQVLVSEYDELREGMPGGSARTGAMNEVAAKMRALSLAARPVIRSFISGNSPGDRLAAICILQVVPESGFFPWLVDRIKTEEQAFILFQASVAILELIAKGRGAYDREVVKRGINQALQHVKNFKGGTPDRNTVDVLTQALAEVG
jgi:hypothetical protein